MNVSRGPVRVIASPGTTPSNERIAATTDLVESMLDLVIKADDPSVAMNALMGTYCTLATQCEEVSPQKAARGALWCLATMLNDVEAPPEGKVEQLERAQVLIDRITVLTQHADHAVVLTALANLLRHLALAHSCCTELCADQLAELAKELKLAASTAAAAGSAHVH